MPREKTKCKCCVCAHEQQEYCPLKKTKVKVNKSRACEYFIYDVGKIRIKQDIPTTMRPDWYHDRRGYINRMKKQQKLLAEQQNKLFESEQTKYISSDPSHPLTGDLSRFTTTASKE